MRAIYLIARREYLSYVATWGFWLSLLLVPIVFSLGAAIPFLAQSSQPVRHYAVIDETGRGLDEVVQAELEEARREQARAALEAMAVVREEAVRERALEAFDSDPDGLEGLDDALDVLGMEESAGAFAEGFGRRLRVEAPARDPDALRPYLTGERTIDTPSGPRPLYAAIFIREGEDGLRIDYYSANIAELTLASQARDALTRHQRREFLYDFGLDQADIEALNAVQAELQEFDASAAPGEDAVITTADRAPFIAAIGLALILWMSIFSVANMLLTSLIEEKGGKILEVLLSTTRYHEILIGKLAGVAGVSFTLFAVWGSVGALATFAGGSALSAADPDLAEFLSGAIDPALFAAALGYFVIGYLMYGAAFLAVGSLCETLQDAQTLMSPLILFMMAPLFIVAFSVESMESLLIQIASWVPIWTPFIMIARLPHGVPAWELAGTTALMLGAMVGVLALGAAVFRQGALGAADAESVKRIWARKKA